eukprot:TRINITY_DN2075_c0_g1_i1.p1 TRINITY_DN2075_c0_g1~~TRINITY_DN2075_c0_g1_i1.p1  ORF type:complete len:307 (+),score=102.69 TRINITY_DN2075_c0_g1_i1:114-1034(+)
MANSEDLALIRARAKLIEEHLAKLTDDESASSALALLKAYFAQEGPLVTDDDEIANDVEAGRKWIGDFIDHTLLKPVATRAEITQLCNEAKEHNFTAVCVNGSRVKATLSDLENTKVNVAAVIGFPLGAATPASKAAESRELVQLGTKEIDMVINMGLLKDGDYLAVLNDIKAVVKAIDEGSNGGSILKVILECGALTREEIVDGGIISVLAGADFIKTSTGFGFGGAKIEDVRIMATIARTIPRPEQYAKRSKVVLVKASGGVRTFPDSIAMIRVGARRIGTSSGVTIAQQAKGTSSAPSASSGY